MNTKTKKNNNLEDDYFFLSQEKLIEQKLKYKGR